MKIWKDRYTIKEFLTNMVGYECRQKCTLCKTSWIENKTKTVSYAISKQGKPIYICDKCICMYSQ